jgi:hypothetical protein
MSTYIVYIFFERGSDWVGNPFAGNPQPLENVGEVIVITSQTSQLDITVPF